MATASRVKRIARGGFACLAVMCSAVYGCSLMQPSASATAEQLAEGPQRIQYYYYVNELIPCMRALRYRVGPVPDMEDFLSQIPALAWTPWDALRMRASLREIAQIRSICPPDPTDLYPTPLPIREVTVTDRQLSRTIGG